MENNRDKFDAIAMSVLAEYGIEEPRLAFIRHSDNVTYQVTAANSERFLLRIHIPVTSALGAHGADYDMVHSEVTWLSALRQDTDLTLPEPVRNRSGSLVTFFPQEGHSAINCTLLRWIDGKPYHRELESPQTAYQIGVIIATLHNHTSRWRIPEGFKRPRRDIPYFKDVLNGLLPAVKDGRICIPDYAELSKSISILVEMMSKVDEDCKSTGLMHADTHKGNILYYEGKIRLIDFSFCAFGNYMFDLGICFSDMKEELHTDCMEGYLSLRVLPDHYQQWIEGFFLGSMVGTFSFWVSNPGAQEILARKVPQITNDYARRFNRGEHFWF
jgi:Ser/Thr protein kinase RdoA (MazF antagonist)